ncbi:MAG: penicillin-binding protein 2 [Clostridiales bacterium]|nr:penicillin-binding protein 2 [Clostridiales bacterium]
MYKRLTILSIIFLALFSTLYMRTYVIMNTEEYKQAVRNQGKYTLNVGGVNGNIYDCNFKLLNNNTYEYLAAINPTSDAIKEVLPYVKDRNDFYNKLKYEAPFVCAVDKDSFECEDITVFKVPVRTAENQLAQHIIGYTQNGVGVTGIELSFDKFLRSIESKNKVIYNIDGTGSVLNGKEKMVEYAKEIRAGIVTTIDADIQEICENAAKDMAKGSVVVMDVKTGEIRAMLSKPDYSVNHLEKALASEDSPLINRPLYAYNVGSIFKLVIAAEALNGGLSKNFMYECTGSIDVNGQIFNCHKRNGHGHQDMENAIINSCNTYFINLVQYIDTERLWNMSNILGFGRETVLANNIVASSGNLPSVSDLSIPAEKSNFSFGQGKLLSTPVQITTLTCAIANGGDLPKAKLIRGTTMDGKTVDNEAEIVYTKAFSTEVAIAIQDYMIAAINENEDSNAKPDNIFAAGKTSTAQTGRYDENGKDICHAWITGFFPVANPEYAVTVLVEDGGFGNDEAAPIFKKIADGIYK